jgi:lipid-A-disaccharide synthase-like uncharacterized protein
MYFLMGVLGVTNPTDAVWVTVGLLGQLMFMMRFIVQWIASERAGRSLVPMAFWFFSIAGSLIVLAYGLHKGDRVIILGQLPGTLIYVRNIWLILRARRA